MEHVLHIEGESGAHVDIRLTTAAEPGTKTAWDEGWLPANVAVHAGGFTGSFKATFRVEDFPRFREALLRLYETLKGEARFDTMEGQLEMSLVGDGLGHVRVAARARDDAGIGNVLTFALQMDQTQLPRLLSQLDALVKRI